LNIYASYLRILENSMPVIHSDQATVHSMHGACFTAYASPDRGSRELCAWRIEIPGHTKGIPHHVSREEVLYVLTGTLHATVDGRAELAAAGDAILVPAGARFAVDNLADGPATAWVTTSVGLRAILPDGSWITPAWTQ
jgi:mannose-6-phosphate isomerase-like protein (cupin superfamily)